MPRTPLARAQTPAGLPLRDSYGVQATGGVRESSPWLQSPPMSDPEKIRVLYEGSSVGVPQLIEMLRKEGFTVDGGDQGAPQIERRAGGGPTQEYVHLAIIVGLRALGQVCASGAKAVAKAVVKRFNDRTKERRMAGRAEVEDGDI